ncbi:ribonuclease III [Candidatus Dojkabacteria bacterium]|nr:ribonuclease III [Candidatus Dojkabacteria bacterium]
MDKKEYIELAKRLEVEFKDINLLIKALTHRSYINENRKKAHEHNERLEFLGDAVLELAITEYLFKKYQQRPEGDLTSFRSAIVCTDSLAMASRRLDLGKYLRLSHGEAITGGRDKDYILANTFEALLGAVYLEHGYDKCYDFVEKVLVPKIDRIVKLRLDINSKTKFQEVAQARFGKTPSYRVLKELGPDHDRIFTIGVYVGNKKMGTGKGPNKQSAEEIAAKEALDSISKTKDKS